MFHPSGHDAIRSGEFFGCNARFPDGGPVDLFSVVLAWPTDDSSEATMTLLVPTAALQPVVDRLAPGQTMEICDGPREIAAAVVVARQG